MKHTIELTTTELETVFWILHERQTEADDYLQHGSDSDPELHEAIIKTIEFQKPHIASVISKMQPAIEGANDDQQTDRSSETSGEKT